MKKEKRNAAIIWVIITLILNFMLYQTAISNAYMTKAERANPMIYFWKFLPQTAMVCGIIVVIGYLIYLFMLKSKNK